MLLKPQGTRRTSAAVLACLLLPALVGVSKADTESRDAEKPAAGASPAAARPNIILIVTDDQDVPSLAEMPNVQRHLVATGLTFDHAYATTPICCPARASILRGQYTHNHEVLTASGPAGTFFSFATSGRESSTVATWLDAVGYNTFFAGKYMNGYGYQIPAGQRFKKYDYTAPVDTPPPSHVPPGWDQWFGLLAPLRHFDYRLNENGVITEYGSQAEDYLTDVLRDKAVDFIRSAAEGDQPFFMVVTPFAPHAKPQTSLPTPAPRHADASVKKRAPRGPSFNEADVGDKPLVVRRRPVLTDQQIAAIDKQYAVRLQALLAVDEMVEAIFATLASTREIDNTYVFYTTDNGIHMGQHRLPAGKGTPYEEDIIVPLVVRGPDVARGSREHLVLLSDLTPTIAELAGAPVPEFVDGRSILPLLATDPVPTREWRQAFLVEYWFGTPGELTWRGIRTTAYKYVEWMERGHGGSGLELYDLDIDPFELESRHGTAEPKLVTGLASWLEALSDCAGATCRAFEDAPPPIGPAGPME